ncbi:hypothetical protein DXB96_05065 [Clostridium sp. OM07-10AC]|nr:hypothetical protein DXC08_01730 [Clostridium sp. OM07-9AC]RHV06215.1 hypothetical protein DXB96_05065 [Clostridium sp. OM07-10AC]
MISLVVCIAAGRIFYKIYEAYCGQAAYATLGDGFLCLLVEAVFAGIYVFLLKSHRNRLAVLVVLCAQLAVTSVVSFAPNKENSTVFSSGYLEQANNVAKNMETETEAFERIKNTDYKIDHIHYPLVLGKQAISNYWHVISPNLQPNFSALATLLTGRSYWMPEERSFPIRCYISSMISAIGSCREACIVCVKI